MTRQQYELLPDIKPEPLFETEEAYQSFRARFQQEIKPALDLLQEARLQSEEDAKQHLVR